MELTMDSDIYEPHVDDAGNYRDYLPPTSKFVHGVRCPCGARKDHVFDSRGSFAVHIKSKTHQRWVEGLTMNKQNFYTECEKLKEVVKSQQCIIARLEREVAVKLKTIDYLTHQLMTMDHPSMDATEVVNDLLSFD